jgi:metal-sulfur cluster biosynthetic enzyme
MDSEFLFQQLKTVEDPDVHVNVVDLGLIYSIEENTNGCVVVAMTLTSPSCPMGDFLIASIRQKILSIHPDREVAVNLVFDPPWNWDMITEEGKMELGIL